MSDIICPIESEDTGYVPWSAYQELKEMVLSLLALNGIEPTAGTLTAVRSQYYTEGNSGINANNSDIIGLNGLYFRDVCNTGDEGMNFPRSNGNYDTLKVMDGKVLLKKDRELLDDSEEGFELLYEDTGWISAETITPAFELYYPERPVEYRRKNGVVYLRGTLRPAETIEAGYTNHVMFTLPEGFRPPESQLYRMQGTGTSTYCLTIFNNGNCTFSRYGTTAYQEANTNVMINVYAEFIPD